jgi:HEPN superfamily AbiU2-like protein
MDPAPTIEQIISTLMNQVVVGKAHLAVAKGLANSDPVVLNAATVFFGMSIDAHLYSSQMYAARLHDRDPKAVTVKTLLKRADEEAGTAKYGSASDVRAAVTSSEKTLSEIEESLDALTTWRNVRLAHTDPLTINDPVKVAADIGPHFPDLETIFDRTGDIVNKFSRLYQNIGSILEILDQTDYETVVEFISEVKCERIRRYEAEFGRPAPFPRPKGCQ